MCVCVCVCVQLSQVCLINQLSGQFICWVTSCNFPPDSRPLCQVGITLRAHDKTLHLSLVASLLLCPTGFYQLSFLHFLSLFPPPDVSVLLTTPCYLATTSPPSYLISSFPHSSYSLPPSLLLFFFFIYFSFCEQHHPQPLE